MTKKLNFGLKVKNRRIELGMTQKEVAGDFMTRNMLSVIESGRAMPSVESAEYLSSVLNISLPYLFSYDDDYFFYEKKEKMSLIHTLYKARNYTDCMELIDSLSGTDDELKYIYSYCAFNLGKEKVMDGSLYSAEKYLKISLTAAAQTCYDTYEIETVAPLYLSVASNIQAPLLELDSDRYEQMRKTTYDYEFFKYVTMDYDYKFKNENYQKHLEAKQLLKKYNFLGAIALLKELEESKNKEYNAYMLFGVYSDIELAYKQLGDFENAYRYASKKLSLISAFKD